MPGREITALDCQGLSDDLYVDAGVLPRNCLAILAVLGLADKKSESEPPALVQGFKPSGELASRNLVPHDGKVQRQRTVGLTSLRSACCDCEATQSRSGVGITRYASN